MTLVSIFELLAAISAVITVWVYDNKDNYAPLYGMVSNIIALWNPHIGERFVKRYYTTTGLIISDIQTYSGMYIVEWQDGGRELRCK